MLPPMTPIILSIPNLATQPNPTYKKPSYASALGGCLEKSLFRPSYQGPSRPGLICAEPSRDGGVFKGPTF